MSSEDVLKIVNLKHAWEFILNKNVILSDTNFPLLCETNKLGRLNEQYLMKY